MLIFLIRTCHKFMITTCHKIILIGFINQLGSAPQRGQRAELAGRGSVLRAMARGTHHSTRRPRLAALPACAIWTALGGGDRRWASSANRAKHATQAIPATPAPADGGSNGGARHWQPAAPLPPPSNSCGAASPRPRPRLPHAFCASRAHRSFSSGSRARRSLFCDHQYQDVRGRAGAASLGPRL
jgi:hypothetical protein